jgi:hypothetical protein
MTTEGDPKTGGDAGADAKSSSMRLFIFVVLVLVVFNLILFFKLVVAPDKGPNPNLNSPAAPDVTRKP